MSQIFQDMSELQCCLFHAYIDFNSNNEFYKTIAIYIDDKNYTITNALFLWHWFVTWFLLDDIDVNYQFEVETHSVYHPAMYQIIYDSFDIVEDIITHYRLIGYEDIISFTSTNNCGFDICTVNTDKLNNLISTYIEPSTITVITDDTVSKDEIEKVTNAAEVLLIYNKNNIKMFIVELRSPTLTQITEIYRKLCTVEGVDHKRLFIQWPYSIMPSDLISNKYTIRQEQCFNYCDFYKVEVPKEKYYDIMSILFEKEYELLVQTFINTNEVYYFYNSKTKECAFSIMQKNKHLFVTSEKRLKSIIDLMVI